jgi:hypothetical protein
LGLLGILAAEAAPKNGRPAATLFEERLLAKIPDHLIAGEAVFSPSGDRVAVPLTDGKRWAIQVNERRGPFFDRVGTPWLAPDGVTVYYVAAEGDRKFLVRGEGLVLGARAPEDREKALVFDAIREVVATSRAVAYLGFCGEKAWLVHNETAYRLPRGRARFCHLSPEGRAASCAVIEDLPDESGTNIRYFFPGAKEQPAFDAVNPELRFYGKSGEPIYLAFRRSGETREIEKVHVVIGERIETFDEVRSMREEGSLVRFLARRGKKLSAWEVPLESLELRERPILELPESNAPWKCSRNAEHVAWVALEGKKKKLLWKSPLFEGPEGTYEDVDLESLRFKASLRVYAVAVVEGGKACVIANGKKDDFSCDRVEAVRILESGTVAYVAKKDGRCFVRAGERTGPVFSEIEDFEIGPGGDQVEYRGRRDGLWFRVIGEKTTEEGWDEASSSVSSEDGSVWAYRVRRGSEAYVIANGKKSEKFKAVGPPVVSPDGKRIAYWARESYGRELVVIDGKKTEAFDRVLTDPRISADGTRVAFGAIEDGTIFWKVIDLEEAP